ncbi:MFS transporter [Deinococcus radiopugnans]|uniref:MFS family permease n=1 Tax=Deinococcus radiopugnans ATCC 19172 TaxID=585398 RepID=A0A5C4Y7U7_9DEIO|nr:MFS transporter [Deinococcus radiopugnans]MBB6017442.1 MFS family permease [Deinococcus radiopugnans ATCC 19172]TNM71972.1 MFS transporter [Deinococcus radiopugnans ATCC 19172]
MTHPAAGRRPLVWALAGLTTVAYGALYYAQPLLAVATEHERGWTRAQTNLAFTLALLVTAFMAPAVGRALDARGGRGLLSVGALLGALAFTLLAASTTYVVFLLGWLLAGAAMALTFYEAAFTALGQQVQGAVRTRATLTITLIAGLASTIFVPLTTALLGQWGLKGTFLGLAGLLLLAAGVTWSGLPPERTRWSAAGPSVPFQPDPPFRTLTLAFTLARIVTVGIGLQLAPLLLAAGHSPALAAGLTGLMGLAALPGRVVFVPLLARFGALPLTTALFGQLAAGAALLHFAQNPVLAALGIVAFGLASGALTLARAELLAQRYPPEVFGAANGRMARPVNLAQALTPFGVGLLLTWTGGYSGSLWLLTGLGVAAGVALLAGAGFNRKAAGDQTVT